MLKPEEQLPVPLVILSSLYMDRKILLGSGGDVGGGGSLAVRGLSVSGLSGLGPRFLRPV
jgi:hypothetical protein